jgi:hypothetical protein
VGCDYLNQEIYRVRGVTEGSPEAERLKVLVTSVATKHGLKNATAMPVVPNALLFYTEPDVKNFHTDVGARFDGSDVLVDLNAGVGPRVPKFIELRKALESALAGEFGSKCEIRRYEVVVPCAAGPNSRIERARER